MSTRKASAADLTASKAATSWSSRCSAAKSRESSWRIGTEHEKLVYKTDDHRAPSYDEPGGIRDILMAMRQFGWEPVEEGGAGRPVDVIAMCGRRRHDQPRTGGPAGTVRRAGGKPAPDLRRNRPPPDPVQGRWATSCGVGFLGLGMWPDKTRAELPVMPKGRYAIMLRHMPRVGTHGARHDAAHLHHSGESRLLVTKRIW